jgi:hypothetical protein
LGQAIRGQGHQGTVPGFEEESRIPAPRLDDGAIKLLEEELKERPFATLGDRCDYVEVMSGLLVSCSTMCRAIARIGTTRKKGGAQPPSATSS